MNRMKKRMGALLAGAVIASTVWACAATRNSDGSISISFAPDMAVTAWGLEDALHKLTKLLDKCITGNYSRPCTPTEMDQINKAMRRVVRSKDRLGEFSSRG
jgi:hypothetical protein